MIIVNTYCMASRGTVKLLSQGREKTWETIAQGCNLILLFQISYGMCTCLHIRLILHWFISFFRKLFVNGEWCNLNKWKMSWNKYGTVLPSCPCYESENRDLYDVLSSLFDGCLIGLSTFQDLLYYYHSTTFCGAQNFNS
jgi:hypothetical protein